MRKRVLFLFSMAAMLLLPQVGRATEDSVTVANGTTTSEWLPIYGYYQERAQHNQVIYPSDSLTVLVGQNITGMTFYVSQQANGNWNTTVTISLGITTESTLSGITGNAVLTEVWEGPMSALSNTIHIDFADAFPYSGGNLLLDVQSTAGSYSSARFYGVSATGAGYTTYGASTHAESFIPKTTFSYSDQPMCRRVNNLTVSNITNSGATISWGAGDQETQWTVYVDGVMTSDSPVFDSTYTITGLDANTEYEVGVRALCSWGDSSNVATESFRTLCQNGNCQLQVNGTSTYYGGVDVWQNGSLAATLLSASTYANENDTIDICNGDSLVLTYHSGSYSSGTLTIIDAAGTELASVSKNTLSNGDTIVAVANGCPTCIPVTGLTVSSFDANNATISWSAGNDESAWAVYLNGAAVAGSPVYSPSFSFSGLAANTNYTVSVMSVCDVDDTAALRSVSFRTLCQNGNCQIEVVPSSTYTYGTYYNPTVAVYQNGSEISTGNGSRTVDICNGDSLVVLVSQMPSSTYYTPSVRVTDVAGTDLFNGSVSGMSAGDTLVAVANGCPSCIPVSNLTLNTFDANSATISWTAGNDETAWAVYLDGVEVSGSPVSTTSFTLTGLTSNTDYTVSVRSVCDVDDTAAARSISFHTECEGYAELPFSSGFENLQSGDMPDCWLQVQTGTNTGLNPHPVFPSAYRHTPNAHNSNVYFEFESNLGETEILALPRMQNIHDLQLSFYASVVNINFLFEAGVIETDENGNDVFVPVDTVDLVAGSSFSSAYRIYNVLFNTYEGNGERIAIRTTPNSTSTYTLMIDDFSVIYVGVPVLGPFEPASRTYTIGVDTTFSFHGNLMTGSDVTYQWTSTLAATGGVTLVGDNTDSVTVSYTTVGIDTLSLIASTTFGADTESVFIYVVDPSPVSVFPYATGFEDGDDISWNTANNASGWYIGQAVASTGSRSLYVSSTHGATNEYSNQAIANSFAFRQFRFEQNGEYELSFDWRGDGGSDAYMRAYIIPGIYQPSAGSYPSGTDITGSLYDSLYWNTSSFSFDVTDTGLYTIYFYWYNYYQSTFENPGAAVDNISITKLNCSSVGNLAATNVHAHEADILWSARSGETEWWVVVDSNEGYSVYADSLHLDGFDGETSHTVSVAAVCAPGDTSYAATVSFTTTVSCVPVSNLTVSNVTASSASISWTPGGTETAWKLIVNNGDTVDISGTPGYTLSGLSAITQYTVVVIADCGSDDGTSVAASTTFNTPMVPVDLPYSTGFETTDDTAWACYNSTNGWHIGTAVANTGLRSLYISNDNGTSNNYSNTSTSISYTAIAFNIDAAGRYAYTFDWQANGESNYDYLRAWISPGSASYTPGQLPDGGTYTYGYTSTTPAGWTDLAGGKLNLQSSWQNVVDTVDITTPGVYNIVFMWANDGTQGSSPAGAIDNFSFSLADTTGSNPPQPVTYTVSAASANAAMGTATVSPNGQVAENTSVTFTATASDGYHFVSWTDATGAVVSTANPYTVTVTADLALTANFEANPSDVTYYTVSAASADAAMGTASVSPNGQVAENTSVTFTATANDGYHFVSWTNATGAVASTANPYTVTVSADLSLTANFEANGSQPVECEAPANVTANNISASGANINWTAVEGATGYEIEYGAENFTDNTGTLVQSATTSVALSGLTADMNYHVHVRSLCADGNHSDWSARTLFRTLENQGIDDIDASSIALYPNPATTSVTLSGIAGRATVSVVDMNGRVSGTWNVENGELTIDLTGYAQGAYFVRITGEQQTAIRKLIVK